MAVDETVIQVNDYPYWLYAVIDPDTNHFLHVRLFPTRTITLTEMFLAELREEHLVNDALILVDEALLLKATCYHHILRFLHVSHRESE